MITSFPFANLPVCVRHQPRWVKLAMFEKLEILYAVWYHDCDILSSLDYKIDNFQSKKSPVIYW